MAAEADELMNDVSKEALIAAISPRDPPGAHCKNRLFEWSATAMMLGIALCIVFTPKTIAAGAFRFMLEANWNAKIIATIFFSFGLWRACALWANGHWQPWGARLRALCSLAAAFMWFQMGLALVLLTHVTGTLSVGIPVYVVMTVAELRSCYRAATDELRPR